jgi:sec-independent protein translocase protein TatB
VFGFSGGELAVVLILAALLIGPAKVPVYARRVGAFVRDLRRTWEGTQSAARAGIQSELDELGVAVEDLRPATLLATLRGDEPSPPEAPPSDTDPEPTPPPPPPEEGSDTRVDAPPLPPPPGAPVDDDVPPDPLPA